MQKIGVGSRSQKSKVRSIHRTLGAEAWRLLFASPESPETSSGWRRLDFRLLISGS